MILTPKTYQNILTIIVPRHINRTKKIFKDLTDLKLNVVLYNNLNQINDWTNINDLIPKFYSNKKMKKTGLSGIFAASLELTKEGAIKILQEEIFKKLMIKKNQN